MKKTIVIAATTCLVLCILGMAMTKRNPAHCALCEVPESDVPCILDLHSGKVAELRISTDELSDDPSTFTFSFMDVLGNTGYRDTGARICKVTLPQDNLSLSPSCFCRDCREKLQSVRKDHYAVLDTASKDVYPLREDNFAIGEYSVSITSEERGMCVTVQSIRQFYTHTFKLAPYYWLLQSQRYGAFLFAKRRRQRTWITTIGANC